MTGKWDCRNIPSLQGKTVLVTGGTSGIGFEIVSVLAQAGADVVFTGRSPDTGEQAIGKIKDQNDRAQVVFEQNDISDLEQVRRISDIIKQRYDDLDILINCAGITRLNPRRLSADGYEMQFATNYLGHFALSAQLFPLMRRSQSARIISVSSIAHKAGTLQFDDLQGEKHYSPTEAYRQSKLAQLIFALEYQKRLQMSGLSMKSIPAHPGLSLTNIYQTVFSRQPFLLKLVLNVVRIVGQSAAAGALPVLYAATSPEAEGGIYYGPQGFMDLKGPPGKAHIAPQAQNQSDAVRLWEISEKLTGLRFEGLS